MARKDAGLMAAEAAAAGIPMAFLPAIIARMDTVLAEGTAHLDWTVLGRDHL
jgi:3-hydroxyisobutyrate dehydrogenase-like beta-hydroxyacid dehydrogenase